MATKQKAMLYTPEQVQALGLLAAATGETYSDLVRRLVAAEATRLNIDWPDNMLSRAEAIKKAYELRWPKDAASADDE